MLARVLVPGWCLRRLDRSYGQCTGFKSQFHWRRRSAGRGQREQPRRHTVRARAGRFGQPVGNSYSSVQVSSNGKPAVHDRGSTPRRTATECLSATAQITGVRCPVLGTTCGPTGQRRGDQRVFTSVTGVAPNRVFNIEWAVGLLRHPLVSAELRGALFEDQTTLSTSTALCPRPAALRRWVCRARGEFNHSVRRDEPCQRLS